MALEIVEICEAARCVEQKRVVERVELKDRVELTPDYKDVRIPALAGAICHREARASARR